MSKKVVVILSILALLFAGAAGGLWYTVNGRLEQDANAIAALKEFGTGTYEARLKAPAAAVAKLAEVREESAKKSEVIASRETKITGLEKNKKELEANVAELETKTSELTRARDELKTKSDEFQANASRAESRVKELEDNLVKQTETTEKEIEKLRTEVSADKAGLLADIEKTRQWYAQVYNFSSGKGLQMPLPARPWEAAANKQTGPQFATNIFLAEVIGFDARQAIIVLNVGSASDLTRQGFNLMVGDTVVAKVMITDILNGGISTAAITSGTPNLTVGTAVKLVPLSDAVAPAPAPAAAAPDAPDAK